MSENIQEDSISKLTDEFRDKLKTTDTSTKHQFVGERTTGKKIETANFVLSTIAYVPERENLPDSSDDDDADEAFPDHMFTFNLSLKDIPFTIIAKREILSLVCKEYKYKPPLPQPEPRNSTLVTPFLKKLADKGFELAEQNKLNCLGVSIALNRMKSLSTRRNDSLISELNSTVETNIKYERFGFYWYGEWLNKEKIPVDYHSVRKFYKRLKKINPNKAKQFLEFTENNVPVPFQELREFAKNHHKTKKLIKDFRVISADANIFLSLIDADTLDFNGIYSAYLRVLTDSDKVPVVMSTGYIFPETNDYGKAFKRASKYDRDIRALTASHFPLGVYYPEPNMCVLIPRDGYILPETFINKQKKNLESVVLLKDIQKRRNINVNDFVFSNQNPLITAIPERAKRKKKGTKKIEFSEGFKSDGPPDEDDLKNCKQISQSSVDRSEWYRNLIINCPVSGRRGVFRTCISLISDIYKSDEGLHNSEMNKIFEDLKTYLKNGDYVDGIVKACKARKEYGQNFASASSTF